MNNGTICFSDRLVFPHIVMTMLAGSRSLCCTLFFCMFSVCFASFFCLEGEEAEEFLLFSILRDFVESWFLAANSPNQVENPTKNYIFFR